jgi:TPR repeat protein
VHRGDSTTVVLRLNDAQGDSVVSQASATALSTEAPQAGLGAVNQLLVPILAPGRRIDLTSLADRRPGAVATWLQGEAEYRRGSFDSALVYLRRAVGEDSSLAAAALRGAQAASWKSLLPEAAQFAATAVADVALLPKRQAEYARGLGHYLGGRADSAVYWFTEALRRTPDWTEAHMALGEVYHHLLPAAGAPLDSLAAVEFAAAAVDTGFAPPYFHLAEIAIRRGDLERAERAVARFDRPGSGEDERKELGLMLACARGGREAVDWRIAVDESPMLVLSAAKMLSVAGAFPGCAEDALRTVVAQTADQELRWGGFLLLLNLWAAQGRDSAITTLIDSLNSTGRWQLTSAVSLVDALAGIQGFDSRAAEAIASLRANYGPRYEDSLDGGSLLLLGAWYARSGKAVDANRLQERLSREAAETDDPGAKLRAAALHAHLLLARADTAAALRSLEDLEPVAQRDDLVWGYTESLPLERLTLARLLFSRGRYSEAIRVAEVFDHPSPTVYLPFLPASLDLRYRAATVLTKHAEAAGYRARLKALGRTDLLAIRD